MAKNENVKPTWDRFYNDIKVFIKGLLNDPMNTRLSPYLRMLGLNRNQVVKDLLKKSIITRDGNIAIGEDGAPDTYTMKFSLVGRNFERNCKRLFSKYFEKNVPQKMDEEECAGATTCDSSSGQFLAPLGKKPMRRVIMTEKQIRHILETTSCGSVGNYMYDAPGLVLKTSDGKPDPTYKR